jgi:hypothetical protein
MKKNTMNDNIPRSNNKLFFTTPKDGSAAVNVDFNVSSIDEDKANRKSYNDNITNYASNYANFVPYQGVLVRVYLRDLAEVNNLFLGNSSGYDKIQIPSANVQGATWRTVDNPFPFLGKCVVVNVPAHITNIAKNDILAIPQLQAGAARKGDDSVIVYEHFFVHPDSGFSLPVKDFNSPDFGYAIIPTGIIQGKIM